MSQDDTTDSTVSPEQRIDEIKSSISEQLEKFREIRNGELCLPFFGMTITPAVVNDVFEDLLTKKDDCKGCLNIIIDSGGGDIDAAYNLAMLLRKYGTEKLEFIIPRWAKSAATLLVCSGDRIQMSHIAELGPLDPQITQLNPLEERLETFSPLHIESTMEMIRNEFDTGNEKLATGLMERLQFPLTLGRFIKYLDISEQYLTKLLRTRMFKDEPDKTEIISQKLAKEYTDHAFCINIDEAQTIGLKVDPLEDEELDIVWKIYKLNEERRELQEEIKKVEIKKSIEDLPPEILDKLPDSMKDKSKPTKTKGTKEVNDGTQN